ncbi:hypothetical protein B1L02_17580 [Pseudoalteromonas piscicida]|uniref:M16 family metallopeptidase n=1 Tax=Pseudoalteromonas piscicida TaxID=43662 RepID=UPI000B4FFE2F|nr:pitrilysin family protein [Pseudoalteromonas piscicida]ASD68648.1 hypothetical protein B1L02_17580 [Pseudoalteromonas piscicida]
MLLNKVAIAVMMAATLNGCSQFQSSDASKYAGAALVEQKNIENGDIGIAYQKFELDNGLTVILHEDHSDPLVHVDVTYHVGSAREEIGKSGFAHLFEHMMFQGSKHVADEEHFKIVTEAGGKLNATTSTDRTNYFQTVPVNQLEKMLWLEADRMGFFAQGITQEKFEIQRAAVKNERMMRYDNVPYGQAFEKLHQALYEYGHPYSWMPIGYMSDLNRANSNDLKAFFKRWYGPNNATLTIGGAVTPDEVLPLVQKYFGSIPKGEAVSDAAKQPGTLAESRYVSYEDNVSLPMLRKVYPTVYMGHKDEAALDAIGYFAGQGESSVLYRELVDTQKAVAAFAWHQCFELSCQMAFGALPHPVGGETLARLDKRIDELVADYIQNKLTQEDVDLFITKREAEIVRALQSVEGKVSMLAKFETFHDNPDFLTQQLASIKALKVKDIKRIFEQYIDNKANVVLSIVPKGKPELIVQQDNYTPKFYEPKAFEEVPGEVQLPSITDSFDRSIKPQAGVAKPITLPDLWQAKTENGIDVLGAFDTETPTTTLLLQIPAGRLYDPENKAGVALLTVEMLGQATTEHTPSELAQQLAKLGAEITFEAKSEYIEIKLSTLSKNLTATLDILSEKLLQPKFSESDFARVKSMVSEYSKSERDSAKFLADSALSQVMYQEGNYSKPWLPSQAELAAIELADVKSFYAQQIRPQGSKLSIVSDVAEPKLMSTLTVALSQWQGKGELAMAAPKFAALDGNIVYLVHKENAPQVQIRVARHAVAEDLTAEHFKSQIMNFAFSGSFNSRVNQNLRENKGYTYGIGGHFSGYGDAGQFVISSGINAANVADALKEIQQELSKINEHGLTDEEIQFTRNSIAQRDALKYETPAAKLNFFAMMHAHNVDAGIVDVRAKTIETVGKKELNQLASKYFTPAEMTYVVVGDTNTLSKQLEGKGFTVKQLTIQ